MTIKKLFLVFLFLLIFVPNFIQNNFLVKEEKLSYSQITEVCQSFNIKCVTAINSENFSKSEKEALLKNDALSSILYDVKIYHNVIIVKLFTALIFLLLLFVILKDIYKYREKVKTETLDKSLLFSLIFLIVYDSVNLIVLNLTKLTYDIVFFVLTVKVLFFVGFFFIFRLCIKNINKALLCAFLLSLFINFYNALNLFRFDIFVQIILVLFTLNIVLQYDFGKKYIFVKYFSSVLAVLCCVQFFITFLNSANIASFLNKKENVTKNELQVNKKSDANIYLILLDMYAGEYTFNLYNQDDSAFYDYLREKGFMLKSDFTSNYNRTPQTIPSVLNFDYGENLNFADCSDAVNNSALFNVAKKQGHKIYYYNSWPMQLNVKENVIDFVYTDSTNLYKMTYNLLYKNSLFYNNFNFLVANYKSNYKDCLDKVLKIKDKKLLFLHVLAPHEPYLYDENGRELESTDNLPTGKDCRKFNDESYFKYVKYTNKLAQSLIDKIISEDENAKIVVFGDHGVRRTFYFSNEKIHLQRLIKEDKHLLKCHYNTILAYYDNDLDREKYKDVKSLVNFFRIFSNENFGTDYKKLKDKQYYIYSSNTSSRLKNFDYLELDKFY